MTDAVRPAETRTVSLGDVDPAGSRQLGRRSAVCLLDDTVVAGLADGTVAAFDRETLDPRWRAEGTNSGGAVTLVPFDGGVLAGERGSDGTVRLLDAETGAERWTHRGAADVGEPRRETRFFYPFVVDAVTRDGRAYVAVRRYERGPDGERTFRSAVSAFDPAGERRWRFETDASVISLDAAAGRVGAACNRCPGEDRDGLVVLDADSGAVRRRWDPPGEGDRRVGDLSLLPDGVVVASHADYRGYRLDENEDDPVRWTVDLGRPVERAAARAANGTSGERREARARDDEPVYAYPNHVHATDAGAVFVTGNTYPAEGRETDARHPAEHAAVGVTLDGDESWRASVGGFSHELAADGDTVAVPGAQHFRERDPSVHGLRAFDVADGERRRERTAGVVTAAAVRGEAVAAVEEPVAYHDDGDVRGAYRLRV